MEQGSLICCKRHLECDEESVSFMVASWLGQLSKQLKTEVCSLLCWRASQKTQPLGDGFMRQLGGHTVQEKNALSMNPGRRDGRGNWNVRDKIIVWTSIKASSGCYIEEGYTQHLVLQILFKSKRPQGAFCEDLNCISVRCALRIHLGEGSTGNLVFCIFCFCILIVYKADLTWGKCRLDRKQNSNF